LLPFYIASGVLTVGEGSLLVLISPYLELRHVGVGTIGIVVSVYGIASLLARVPAGAAYRADRVRWQVTGGALIMAVAFAAIPMAHHPALIAALVGLDGIGFAIATTAAMAGLIKRRPPDVDAGPIMGWYTGSVGAGYALAGFVAGPLADGIGIPGAFTIMAMVPLVGGAALARSLGANADQADDAEVDTRGSFVSSLMEFGRAPAAMWIAFAVSLYINLVSGATFTLFPLYGLAIGLTLTQIGALSGIHGIVAAGIRFASPWIFRWIPYRRSLSVMVVVSGLAVTALAGSSLFLLLAVAWAVIGLARGVLRVASGALVLDSAGVSDGQQGAASGIYLAGLDLGKILGPIVGGFGAEIFGIRTTFVALGVLFPLVYAGIVGTQRGRQRVRASASLAAYTDANGEP
jgi:predicted MFS family arabinose efflux permease